jgi:hypothetical protein
MAKRMVYSLAAPLFAGERFELTVCSIDYRYIPIDYESTVREAARSVNAENYWSLKREAMPLEARRCGLQQHRGLRARRGSGVRQGQYFVVTAVIQSGV